jgi:hypothetical protein
MLVRTDSSSSAAVCGSLTYASQSAGRSTGQSLRIRQASASRESRAFGLTVTAAQRAMFMAAGIAVALLNWRIPPLPL